MQQGLVVIGGGGFGREVVDLARELAGTPGGREVIGVLDDNLAETDRALLTAVGVEYLGTVEDYLASAPPAHFVIGIANPRVRRLIDAKMAAAGHRAHALVHPSVTLGSLVEIGPGAIICAGVRLTTNIRVGRHVHININATVGHDAVLNDYVTVFPAAAVSGNVRLEEEVSLGVGSAVLQGLTVGQATFVGAAALVTKDIAPGLVVKGIPAR